MIQRPQTLFLLGAVILLTVSLFFPVWSETANTFVTVNLDAFHITKTNGINNVVTEVEDFSVAYLAGMVILAIFLNLIAIFKFKNRMRQLQLVVGSNVVLSITVCLMAFIAVPQAQALLKGDPEGFYQLGFFFPLFCILINIVANRFIKKDEKLVRSVDRIR